MLHTLKHRFDKDLTKQPSLRFKWLTHVFTRRPDVLVIHKEKAGALIVGISAPADRRIAEKDKKKVEKYQSLKREMKRFFGTL